MKLIKNKLFVVSTKIINNKYKDILETWDLKNSDEIKHKRNFSFNKADRSNNYIMNDNILCKQGDNTFTLSNVDSKVRITPTSKNNDCHFVKIDGNRLFKGKKEIEIWNIEKFKRVTKSTLPQSHPEKIKVLRGHESWVHWIQVCGHLLVSGTQIEKNVRVWNIETGECVQLIDSPIDNIKLAFNRIILVVPSEESSNRGETNLERMSYSKHNRNQNIIIFDYNNSK
jgi:WD40 repeat protein